MSQPTQSRGRSSHRRCSTKKGVLENFAIFTRKQRRCFFLANIAKFLRTSILKNIFERLSLQSLIQNPVKHLRWNLLLTLNVFAKTSSQMFDWVLNTPPQRLLIKNLLEIQIRNLLRLNCLCAQVIHLTSTYYRLIDVDLAFLLLTLNIFHIFFQYFCC